MSIRKRATNIADPSSKPALSTAECDSSEAAAAASTAEMLCDQVEALLESVDIHKGRTIGAAAQHAAQKDLQWHKALVGVLTRSSTAVLAESLSNVVAKKKLPQLSDDRRLSILSFVHYYCTHDKSDKQEKNCTRIRADEKKELLLRSFPEIITPLVINQSDKFKDKINKYLDIWAKTGLVEKALVATWAALLDGPSLSATSSSSAVVRAKSDGARSRATSCSSSTAAATDTDPAAAAPGQTQTHPHNQSQGSGADQPFTQSSAAYFNADTASPFTPMTPFCCTGENDADTDVPDVSPEGVMARAYRILFLLIKTLSKMTTSVNKLSFYDFTHVAYWLVNTQKDFVVAASKEDLLATIFSCVLLAGKAENAFYKIERINKAAAVNIRHIRAALRLPEGFTLPSREAICGREMAILKDLDFDMNRPAKPVSKLILLKENDLISTNAFNNAVDSVMAERYLFTDFGNHYEEMVVLLAHLLLSEPADRPVTSKDERKKYERKRVTALAKLPYVLYSQQVRALLAAFEALEVGRSGGDEEVFRDMTLADTQGRYHRIASLLRDIEQTSSRKHKRRRAAAATSVPAAEDGSTAALLSSGYEEGEVVEQEDFEETYSRVLAIVRDNHFASAEDYVIGTRTGRDEQTGRQPELKDDYAEDSNPSCSQPTSLYDKTDTHDDYEGNKVHERNDADDNIKNNNNTGDNSSTGCNDNRDSKRNRGRDSRDRDSRDPKRPKSSAGSYHGSKTDNNLTFLSEPEERIPEGELKRHFSKDFGAVHRVEYIPPSGGSTRYRCYIGFFDSRDMLAALKALGGGSRERSLLGHSISCLDAAKNTKLVPPPTKHHDDSRGRGDDSRGRGRGDDSRGRGRDSRDRDSRGRGRDSRDRDSRDRDSRDPKRPKSSAGSYPGSKTDNNLTFLLEPEERIPEGELKRHFSKVFGDVHRVEYIPPSGGSTRYRCYIGFFDSRDMLAALKALGGGSRTGSLLGHSIWFIDAARDTKLVPAVAVPPPSKHYDDSRGQQVPAGESKARKLSSQFLQEPI